MTAPQPRVPGYPVTIRFPLHWGEMDALGHANNTRFFTWMESARIAYFERLAFVAEGGLTAGEPNAGPILATTHCEFLRPVLYPADLLAAARVAEVGSSSLRMEYAIASAEEPEHLYARGGAVVVLVHYHTLDKIRVPELTRAGIAMIENQP